MAYITIQKKRGLPVNSFAGTLEELANIHGVEADIRIPDERDIEAAEMGEADWPEGSGPGDTFAWIGDSLTRFETVDDARRFLIQREVGRGTEFSFFGTPDKARALLKSGLMLPSRASILRRELERAGICPDLH